MIVFIYTYLLTSKYAMPINTLLYIIMFCATKVSASLVYLDMHSSSFLCIDMKSFPAMPRLKIFNLNFCRITYVSWISIKLNIIIKLKIFL